MFKEMKRGADHVANLSSAAATTTTRIWTTARSATSRWITLLDDPEHRNLTGHPRGRGYQLGFTYHHDAAAARLDAVNLEAMVQRRIVAALRGAVDDAATNFGADGDVSSALHPSPAHRAAARRAQAVDHAELAL
jgi:hypothetical protein